MRHAAQETGEFSLTVERQQPGEDALCPFDCSGHGTCASPGACLCDMGWQGAFCQVCPSCPLRTPSEQPLEMHRFQEQELGLQGSLEWSPQGTFREMAVFNPRTQRGHLQPGQWDYFEMVLDPLDTSWMVRLPLACLMQHAFCFPPSFLALCLTEAF